MNPKQSQRLTRAGGLTSLALSTLIASGCATKNRPADAPLPPRNRVNYDAETTLRLAVADRLAEERRALAAAYLPRRPSTRPAEMTLPAPQLIPAPQSLGDGFSQGGSASPLAEVLANLAESNEQATRSPTPAGFLNAIHYYDYAPGVRYNVVTAAGHLTAIQLRPGERLLSLSCSDSQNYTVERVRQGGGEAAQTLILVKPKQAGGQSNWVLTTDERTYFVDVLVNDQPNYQSAIAWHYPVDDVRLMGEQDEALRVRAEKGGGAFSPDAAADVLMAQAEGDELAEAGPGPAVGPLGMNLDDLNFGYVVLYQPNGRDGKEDGAAAPAWAPLRAFDDGLKTYLHLPGQARAWELPPLYALDHPEDDEPLLVNYRRSGDYLVADRLAPAWEMRAGEAPQQLVRVVRGEASDPGRQPLAMAAPPEQSAAKPQRKPRRTSPRLMLRK